MIWFSHFNAIYICFYNLELFFLHLQCLDWTLHWASFRRALILENFTTHSWKCQIRGECPVKHRHSSKRKVSIDQKQSSNPTSASFSNFLFGFDPKSLWQIKGWDKWSKHEIVVYSSIQFSSPSCLQKSFTQHTHTRTPTSATANVDLSIICPKL